MHPSVPRLTAELFIIPTEGAYLVYAPLRQAAFLTNAAGVNQLANLQEGKPGTADGDAGLLELLRELEIVDGGEEVRPITTAHGDPRPTAVTLFLTTACNLRCSYCYAAAGDTPTKVMPLEVAQNGIDFVIRNALDLGRPAVELDYHGGGEPSVHWKVLTASWEYARRRADESGLELRSSMASNGVMSDAKIDWVLAHLDGVSLSFDGVPEVHDAHRLTVLGECSSAQVIHTMRRFDQAAYNYGVRLTVTREHIPRLPESVRYICRHFQARDIQVEPAYQLGRWRDAPSAETAEFIAAYREAKAAARELGRDILFSAARVGSLSNHFCGALVRWNLTAAEPAFDELTDPQTTRSKSYTPDGMAEDGDSSSTDTIDAGGRCSCNKVCTCVPVRRQR